MLTPVIAMAVFCLSCVLMLSAVTPAMATSTPATIDHTRMGGGVILSVIALLVMMMG